MHSCVLTVTSEMRNLSNCVMPKGPLMLIVLFNSTTAVYLSFGGMNLPNNGYVTISQLGNSTDTGLACRTDQSGDADGHWFNPSGDMLGFSSEAEGFYVSSGSDGAYLLRGTGRGSIPVEPLTAQVQTRQSLLDCTMIWEVGRGGI